MKSQPGIKLGGLVLVFLSIFSFHFAAAQSAKELFDQGVQHYYQAQYDEAIASFEVAKSSFTSSNEFDKIIDVECEIVGSLYKKGDYQAFEERIKSLEKLILQYGLEDRTVDKDFYRARLDHHYARYHEALKAYTHVINRYSLQGNVPGALKTMLARAGTFLELYLIDSAFSLARKVEGLYQKNNLQDHDVMGSIQKMLAKTFWHRSQFDRAIGYYLKAIDHKKQVFSGDHPDLASLYNDIGIMYRNLMQFEKAIEYQGLSLEMRKRYLGEDHLDVSASYINTGYTLYRKGDVELSLELQQKAYEIRAKLLGIDHPQTVIALEHIGLANGSLENYRKAEEIFHIVLERRKKSLGPVHHLVSYTYYNLGAVADAENDYPKAIEYFDKAAAIASEVYGSHHHDQADNYNRLGNCYLALGDTEKAKSYFHKAIEQNLPGYEWNGDLNATPVITHFLSFREAFRSLLGLAKSFSGTDNLDDLYKALQYIDLNEKMQCNFRKGFTKDGDRIAIASNSKVLSDIAIDINYKLYQQTDDKKYLEEIFRFAEFARATTLLTRLDDAHAKRISGIPDSLLSLERHYRLLKDSLNTVIIDELSGRGNELLIADLKATQFQVNREHEKLISDLEMNFPEYTSRKYGLTPIDTRELQSQIKDSQCDTWVIQYHLTEEGRLFINLISPNDHRIIVQNDPDLKDKVLGLREAIISNEPENFRMRAFAVYQSVFKPIRSMLDKDLELVIIPDGILNFIPFDVLLTAEVLGEDPNNQLPYLIKEFRMGYDLSATLFARRSREVENKKPDLLAYAPEFQKAENSPVSIAGLVLRSEELVPLEGAREESLAISHKMKGQSRIGDVATESMFKEEAAKYGILHLATHSIINDRKPEYSKLIFSESDEENDGQLHAFELQNMELNAQLVTLSACSTGFGKIEEGEGVMSLARAFSAAGVPSVLMSLWPASDQHTLKIMTQFYENLRTGMSKSEALHKAKLSYLHDADPLGANPFYWGSFVLIGDPSPIYGKGAELALAKVSLLVLMMAFLAIFKKLKFT